MDMAPREPSKEPPAKPPENPDAAMAPAEAMRPNAPKPPPAPLNIIQKTFRAEALARLQRAVIADCGFVERLVVFWSNHFCISANKGGPARMWAGSFEREAIRPYVLGRFGDMLKAVEQHPAMLFFLDNQQSLGPDSRAGKNRNRGLNENLAREILELHTLGVGGGYSQDDVTSLANIITGWTYAGRLGPVGRARHLRVQRQCASAGRAAGDGKNLRRVRREAGRGGAGGYRAPSVDREIHRGQIRASLRGRRSATGPGGAARRCLCENRRRSQGAGDWRWWIPMTPGRRRFQKCARLTNSWWRRGRLLAQIPNDPGRYLGALNTLGQPLWAPAGPNGFPDSNAAWAAPEGIKLRLDISAQIASRLADGVDPRDLLELVAADAASSETRRTIERAESRQQALALLLMSPEFQRR